MPENNDRLDDYRVRTYTSDVQWCEGCGSYQLTTTQHACARPVVTADNGSRYYSALKRIASMNTCIEADCKQPHHVMANIARAALKDEE